MLHKQSIHLYLHPVCSNQSSHPDAARAGLYTHVKAVLVFPLQLKGVGNGYKLDPKKRCALTLKHQACARLQLCARLMSECSLSELYTSSRIQNSKQLALANCAEQQQNSHW
jgi:hypothetical protein